MRKISDQFAADVICTAVEGGINYWAVVLKWDGEGSALVEDHDKKTGPEVAWPVTINKDLIQKGIDLLSEGKITLNTDTLGSILVGATMDDAGDVDAEAADAIVQAAIFGDIVYG